MLSYILRCKKTMKVFLKRMCINTTIDDSVIYCQVGLFDFKITLQIKLIGLISIEIVTVISSGTKILQIIRNLYYNFNMHSLEKSIMNVKTK